MENIIVWIIYIIIFFWMGFGLYLLAKKMWIKHAWMGWIPLLNYYIMTQVAGVSFLKYVVIPFVVYLLAIVLGTVSMWFWWGNMFIMIVWGILMLWGYIYMILKYVQIFSATSKRTWRGGWTTAGLFFVPFIMYPVVALKYKKEEKSEKIKDENKKVEL